MTTTSLTTPEAHAAPPASPGGRPHLLAMEIETSGHHGTWVRNFAQVWADYEIPSNVTFLVTRQFFDRHEDVVRHVRGLGDTGIQITCLSPAEEARLEARKHQRYFQGWRLFCDYAERLSVDHGLVMYFDHFQLPMLVGPPAPCPYSVIYFRPTFHYRTMFDKYEATWGEWFKATRKKAVLSRVLRDPRLENLYCLDTFAAEYVTSRMRFGGAARKLADSFVPHVSCPGRVQALRERLEIEDGRRVFGLVGVLDWRKGPRELLAAAQRLTPAVAKKTCLILAGPLGDSEAAGARELVAELHATSQTQVILRDTYLGEEAFQDYVDLCDVHVTTYQRHMGSSSMLIRAAAAGKPVLSSDYGMMGHLVADHQLGLTVDSADPEAVAKAFEPFVEHDPGELMDRDKAAAFAAQHSPAHLAADLSKMFSADVRGSRR